MSISFKLQDMVTDNLLTNQEAFTVLQHWELHILRRKYDAADNASKSPIPGANNIVSQHLRVVCTPDANPVSRI
jgi:hypothetical protein